MCFVYSKVMMVHEATLVFYAETPNNQFDLTEENKMSTVMELMSSRFQVEDFPAAEKKRM